MEAKHDKNLLIKDLCEIFSLHSYEICILPPSLAPDFYCFNAVFGTKQY